MFLSPSFSIPTPSGFVAFDGGGAIEADPERGVVEAPRARTPIAAPAARLAPIAEPVARGAPEVAAPAGWRQSATWEPAAGVRARRVEGVVIAAICGYFVLGFARLLGLL